MHTTTVTNRHYTSLIAATGSGSLGSSWGRPADTVFDRTSRRGEQSRGGPAGPGETRGQLPIVMLTNVAEDVAQTRARTSRDIEAIVHTWTSRPVRYRDRIWSQWAYKYPSLAGVAPMGNWHLATERDAMIDLLRLVSDSPDAFPAWVTKSRALLFHATSTTIPADLADLALAAFEADCDTLTASRRPFLTLYNRARRRTRRTIVAKARHNQPHPILNVAATTTDFDSVDTMVSVDAVCASNNEQRWARLLAATLTPEGADVLPARTRRTHRANYRSLIRTAI